MYFSVRDGKRNHGEEDELSPPECMDERLEEDKNLAFDLSCGFNHTPKQVSLLSEACYYEDGFETNCSRQSLSSGGQCRLCRACREGYWASGIGNCKKCPSQIQILISEGILALSQPKSLPRR